MFGFSLQLLSETFLILRRTGLDMITNVYRCSCELPYRYSCQILMKSEYFGQFFDKNSNVKFYDNPSRGSRICPCGRTDEWTEMTKLRCQFCLIIQRPYTITLNFRHRASCILEQAFRYSPENAFYIFNQQIYFIIWYLLDRASLI